MELQLNERESYHFDVPETITVYELQELAKRFLTVCKMGDDFQSYKPKSNKKYKPNVTVHKNNRTKEMNDKLKKEIIKVAGSTDTMAERFKKVNDILTCEGITVLYNTAQMYTMLEKLKHE